MQIYSIEIKYNSCVFRFVNNFDIKEEINIEKDLKQNRLILINSFN